MTQECARKREMRERLKLTTPHKSFPFLAQSIQKDIQKCNQKSSSRATQRKKKKEEKREKGSERQNKTRVERGERKRERENVYLDDGKARVGGLDGLHFIRERDGHSLWL